MLQKFKITTCVFILCLFGLTLMTVSPVFAADSAAFVECQDMKWKKGKKAKKNCFRDLAQASQPSDGSRSPEFVACQDMKWKKGKKAKKNCFRDLARSLQAESQKTPVVCSYSNCREGTAFYSPKSKNDGTHWCRLVDYVCIAHSEDTDQNTCSKHEDGQEWCISSGSVTLANDDEEYPNGYVFRDK